MESVNIVVPDEYKSLYVTDSERPILKIPHPLLRQVAAEIPKVTPRVTLMVDDMIRQMKRANGVGLAGPQLGIMQRVIVIAPLDYRPMALINPVITKMEGEQIGQEGCLSIPGLYGDVSRAAYIEVEGFDRKGRELALELEGLPARVVQHEIDHLDGILFTDKVIVETLHWQDPNGPDDIE